MALVRTIGEEGAELPDGDEFPMPAVPAAVC